MSSLPRLLYCHLCAEIQKLANLNFTLLLSGGISLNPGPTPNSVSQSIWKTFENKGLHFLHLNLNSILLKLDDLKTTAGNTKAVIIGITESKVDNSISDSEV